MSRLVSCDEILKQFGLEHIDQDWKTECVNYIIENHRDGFDEEFKRQLLYSDLRELVSHTPLAITERATINRPIMVQIMNIQEIGSSGQQQLEWIHQSKPIPRKVLKFELTDGIQKFSAVELDAIPGIDLLSPIGQKALLSFGTIHQGVILVNRDNLKILGGQLATLNVVPALDRIQLHYETKLNIPKMKPAGTLRIVQSRIQAPIANPSLHPTLTNQPIVIQEQDYFDDDLDDQEIALLADPQPPSTNTNDVHEDYWDDDLLDLEQDILDEVEIVEVKKPRYYEFQVEECLNVVNELRFVKASIYSHSKLICKDGFLLNAKLIGNQDSKMDVVFENEFLEHRLGFSFQTLVQKRGTPEERGIKKVKLYN